MNEEMSPGSKIVIHFSLALEDGSEAFSTRGAEPLTCVLGDGTLRPGLELALYGLKAGDRQTLTLEPDQAYGWHDSQLVQQMQARDFPAGSAPEAGQLIGFTLPNGDETAGLVRAVSGDSVTVDFNHPLAGHKVVFSVEVLSVENTP
jgi:FKBP-type peptidyl-prolyl cis-trans isomerase SlpA